MDNILFKDFNLRSKNMLITAKTRTGITSSIMVPAILEDIDKIDYSKKFTIYICCDPCRENIDEIKIFEEILEIVDNKRVQCITLIEHYEHIANILRKLKIGNNNKFLISSQENSNLELIKNNLEKFDIGYINLTNNIICIGDKEYKQEFYFKNEKYVKLLELKK